MPLKAEVGYDEDDNETEVTVLHDGLEVSYIHQGYGILEDVAYEINAAYKKGVEDGFQECLRRYNLGM